MHRGYFQRINSVLLACIAFLIPIAKGVVPFIILLWLLNWLFIQPSTDKWHYTKKNLWHMLAFMALFIAYLLSMSYTNNTKAGWFDIEIKLMLMLAPLAMFTGAFSETQNLNKIFIAFIAGCFFSISAAFGHAIYMYTSNHNPSVFSYTGFSFFMHPTYFALYLNFAVILIINMLFKNNHIKTKWKILIAALIVYFCIGIILAASKAVITTLILTLISTLVLYLNKKNSLRVTLGVCVFILMATSVVLYKPPAIYERITDSSLTLMRYLRNEKLRDIDGTSQRILAWKCSLRLIGKNIITGVGAGDVKDELIKEYYKNEYYYLTEKKLNSHNQFLQTFLATGIAGFVSLLLLFAIPLFWCIRLRNFVYINFLMIVFINFLMESMLEKQAGVVFFAFFNCMLFAAIQNNHIKSNP